jgi:dolichol-phosphate mannosyltransferase
VHAAAISFEGRGGLITAATDTGKTTTVLRTLESRPWRFLSDDMSLLGPEGDLLAFPKPMTISSHTLHAVSTARLTWRERLFLIVQSRLHSRAGRKLGLWLAEKRLPAASLNALVQRIIPPPKYPVERLIPWAQTVPRAQLHLLVLLDRAEEAEERLAHHAIMNALLENADDAYGFPPYAELSPFLSQRRGEDLHSAERAIIAQATRGRSATRLASQEYAWWKRLPHLFEFEPARHADAEPDTQPTAIARS